jgi:TRAP-type C4-dicarboxylate transport system permease small subunit
VSETENQGIVSEPQNQGIVSRRADKIARATDAVASAAAYAAGATLILLMLLTTADVVGRYFFNSPINGVFDLTHFAVSIMVFLGLAYCGYRGGHVVIELLYDKLPPGARRVLNRAINLAGCVLFALIAWRTAVQSIDVRDMGEASQMMEIPLFPLYYMVAFGSGLFAWVMAFRIFVPEPESGAGK